MSTHYGPSRDVDWEDEARESWRAARVIGGVLVALFCAGALMLLVVTLAVTL